MQRISVDLPDPDGPQMTMRSPRVDGQVDVAQHVERRHTTCSCRDLDRDLVGDGHLRAVFVRCFASAMQTSLSVIGGELALQPLRILRNAVADDEEHHGREAEQLPVDAVPLGRGQDRAAIMPTRSNIEMTETSVVSLNRPTER
jgi:hypothetical protein